MTSRSSLRAVLVFVVLIGLMALPDARGQQQAPAQPGTTWNEQQLRDAVDVAAGRQKADAEVVAQRRARRGLSELRR